MLSHDAQSDHSLCSNMSHLLEKCIIIQAKFLISVCGKYENKSMSLFFLWYNDVWKKWFSPTIIFDRYWHFRKCIKVDFSKSYLDG